MTKGALSEASDIRPWADSRLDVWTGCLGATARWGRTPEHEPISPAHLLLPGGHPKLAALL